jgi:hypothetical protein
MPAPAFGEYCGMTERGRHPAHSKRRGEMGMDVCGNNPTTEEGNYFHNSIWFWCPLANYIKQAAPDIAGKCRYWDSNDGDGLDSANALELAAILQAEIDSGRCEHYARIYTSAQEMASDVACDICAGTGTRKPVPECGAGTLVSGVRCNACAGKGHVRPWSTHYPFDVENISEFVAFLRGCGGFAIY